MMQDATAAIASPIPGTHPMSASSPKRTLVPGMRHMSSSNEAM